jgi:uncharacterized protein
LSWGTVMKIDISKLEQGTNKLQLKGDAETLELEEGDLHLQAGVLVDLTLSVYEENIRIDGVARTEVEEECSRCLDLFKRGVEAEIHLYAAAGKAALGKAAGTKASGRAGEDEEEDEEEEAQGGYLFHDGRQLDLRDEVRSAILLSSPMQPLCDPDCKGLCPECGANLNDGKCSCDARPADPRWKGLEKLGGQ